MSSRRRIGSSDTCGASDAEYRSRRRFTVQAARMATSALAPSARESMAVSCDAPANTKAENPMAAPPPRPLVAGVAPATSPNGITPTSIGATARIPASASWRVVDRSVTRVRGRR